MYEHLREKWPLLWKKIKRRFLLYVSLTIGIAAFLIAFFVFQNEMNRKAQAEFKLAISCYQEAVNSQDSKEKLAKYQEARDLYEDILSRYPLYRNKKEVFFYLGNCLYYLGEYDEAGRILQKFGEKYKDDYFSPWVMVKLAFTYEQRKKYQEAIKVYEDVLKRYPESSIAPEALLGVARCQELAKEWDKALKSYEELLSRYPLSEEAAVGEVKIQQLKRNFKK